MWISNSLYLFIGKIKKFCQLFIIGNAMFYLPLPATPVFFGCPGEMFIEKDARALANFDALFSSACPSESSVERLTILGGSSSSVTSLIR